LGIYKKIKSVYLTKGKVFILLKPEIIFLHLRIYLSKGEIYTKIQMEK